MYRYSEIDTAHHCLEKYRRIYLAREQEPGDKTNLRFGSAIHLAIESHFKNEDPMLTFNTYWNVYKQDANSMNEWTKLKNLGEILIARWVKLHAKNYVKGWIEKTIQGQIGKFMFTGMPDFVGEYKGKRSVVDFKTASKEYSDKKIQSNEQLYIYSELVKQFYNYDVEQIVYCILIKYPEPRIQTKTFLLTEEKKKAILDNVETVVEDLSKRTKFPKNPRSCEGCGFFERCYGQDT